MLLNEFVLSSVFLWFLLQCIIGALKLGLTPIAFPYDRFIRFEQLVEDQTKLVPSNNENSYSLILTIPESLEQLCWLTRPFLVFDHLRHDCPDFFKIPIKYALVRANGMF